VVPACTEEVIRFASSLQLFERTTVRDLELTETRIETGQKVAALLGGQPRPRRRWLPGLRLAAGSTSTKARPPNAA
jgi:cytochrome P450